MRFLFFLQCILTGYIVSAQQDTVQYSVREFSVAGHISIRALYAQSDLRAWFAGSHGAWGYTTDGGLTWHVDSITIDGINPEFRSIAVLDDSTVLLLSIASPAYMFKTTTMGEKWKLVYKNNDSLAFFNSMKFLDAYQGIAVGDPIDRCFQVITTQDGGDTWKKTPCSEIVKAEEGEAMFAASNTCLDITSGRVVFATGGKRARVFESQDFGDHFDVVYETPIAQGGKMTGIFSVQFIDDAMGSIAGGNYERSDSSFISLAQTKDFGQTWKKIHGRKPFFGSCIQHFGNEIWITGHDGTYISSYKNRMVKEVVTRNGNGLKYYTLSVPRRNPQGIWMAGSKGRIAYIKIK